MKVRKFRLDSRSHGGKRLSTAEQTQFRDKIHEVFAISWMRDEKSMKILGFYKIYI